MATYPMQNLGFGQQARAVYGKPAYGQQQTKPAQVVPQLPAEVLAGSSGYMTTSPSRDPFTAQPVYASSGGMSNPYLGAQATAITNQANQNLQNNLLPAINSGAVAAGGYGSSRQGIAQGIAMGQTQQGIANALANMYGTAYSHDQDLANQRDIAWWQNDTATRNAQIAANASMYGADKSSAASMYGSDAAKAASMYGADKSSAASMYGADKSAAASMYGANKSAQASMYGADKSAQASMYGADKSSAASMYGADSSRLASMYGADSSRLASMYGTDAQRQASMYGTDAQRQASMYGTDAQREIARLNNATNYTLGLGNLGLGFQNSNNAYDLGLRSNDLGFATLDANIANSNFNNQLQGANFGLNVYNALQGNNNLGLTAGTSIQNTPLNYYQQLANIANSIGQGYGTTTANETAVGSPMLGALGGLQIGSSLARNFGGMFSGMGSSSPQIDTSAFSNNYAYGDVM